MKEATLYDLLQKDAEGTYKSWTDGLRLLPEVTNPSAKLMYESELEDLYAKAQELMDTQQLDSKALPMMKIILSRSLQQWVVLNSNPHFQVIPTY